MLLLVMLNKTTFKVSVRLNKPMGITGPLTEKEIKSIVGDFSITTFVETGTYLGDSTLSASQVFDRVHTIEIQHALHEQAKAKCSAQSNITFHHGDSVNILSQIVKECGNGGVFWFLDAHQSGPESGNNGTFVPLLEELNAILENISGTHIFVIDDVRLFSAFWDWEGISFQSIEQCFKKYDVNIQRKTVSNDRFILYCGATKNV